MKQASCHPERPHYGLGKCKLCYQSDYSEKNREKILARLRSRYRNEPEFRKRRKAKAWESQIKRLYKISADDYWAMYEAQSGKCALCGRSAPPGRHLAVDHDHQTGEIRGLLCQRCNSTAGYLENAEWLTAAFRHIHRAGHPSFDSISIQEMDLHARKNHDYAKGGPPLGNFERVAAILGLYPQLDLSDMKVVALVYALKQLDAVLWGLSAKIKQRVEGLTPRLRDISVYAKIVMCMVEDEQEAHA